MIQVAEFQPLLAPQISPESHAVEPEHWLVTCNQDMPLLAETATLARESTLMLT